MATKNTVLLIKFAVIMTRSRKLPLTSMHPNSNNIGRKVLVAYFKLDKSWVKGRKVESINAFVSNKIYAWLFVYVWRNHLGGDTLKNKVQYHLSIELKLHVGNLCFCLPTFILVSMSKRPTPALYLTKRRVTNYVYILPVQFNLLVTKRGYLRKTI